MFAGLAYDRGGWAAVVEMSVVYQLGFGVLLIALYNMRRRADADAARAPPADDDKAAELLFGFCGVCFDSSEDSEGAPSVPAGEAPHAHQHAALLDPVEREPDGDAEPPA